MRGRAWCGLTCDVTMISDVFSLCRCCGTGSVLKNRFLEMWRKDRRGKSLHCCSDVYDVMPPLCPVEEVRPWDLIPITPQHAYLYYAALACSYGQSLSPVPWWNKGGAEPGVDSYRTSLWYVTTLSQQSWNRDAIMWYQCDKTDWPTLQLQYHHQRKWLQL